MRALLSRLGIRPAIEVLSADGGPVAQAHIVRYRLGVREVLAIVKENVGVEAGVGRDGVTVYTDANLGRVAREDLVIRLPRMSHVADVVQAKGIGKTGAVQTSIVVGGALVLGIDPEPVTMSVTGPAAAVRGQSLTFELRASGPARQLARCHFFGPDGSFLPAYASNVLFAEGKASIVLRPARNDAPGRYKLEVTEVVSGAYARAEFVLE